MGVFFNSSCVFSITNLLLWVDACVAFVKNSDRISLDNGTGMVLIKELRHLPGFFLFIGKNEHNRNVTFAVKKGFGSTSITDRVLKGSLEGDPSLETILRSIRVATIKIQRKSHLRRVQESYRVKVLRGSTQGLLKPQGLITTHERAAGLKPAHLPSSV